MSIPSADRTDRRLRVAAAAALAGGLLGLLLCLGTVLGLTLVRPELPGVGSRPPSNDRVFDLPLGPLTPTVAASPSAGRTGTPGPPAATPSRPTATVPITTPPASPPVATSPSQFYITCRDGKTIVGTSTQGACASQGGIQSVSTTPPDAPPPEESPTTGNGRVSFLNIQGAAPGGQALVSIQSGPGRSCAIVVVLPSGAESTAAGLNNKVTDRLGRVSWQFSVAAGTAPGSGTLRVNCGGEIGVAEIRIG